MFKSLMKRSKVSKSRRKQFQLTVLSPVFDAIEEAVRSLYLHDELRWPQGMVTAAFPGFLKAEWRGPDRPDHADSRARARPGYRRRGGL
ncbi:hypothetical protein Thiosp_03964 [Thiorhodovibrio litoralis]|nr:hypothetical protein Thiosp_03964 [Thiorhodovibrio litoralis]